MSSRTSDSYQEDVSSLELEHSVDLGNVLNGILEEHQVH